MKCKMCAKDTGSDKKQTCSPKCRKAYSRSVTTVTDESVTLGTVTSSVTSVTHLTIEPPCLAPGALTPRTNPDSLNYGKHMTAAQLDEHNLKANRVPIPGDSDYDGVCVKQDGVWRVAA